MAVRQDTKQYKTLKELLGENERATVELVERRFGGAKWFGVAHAYATQNRIIIVRIYSLGIRTSIKILLYRDITEVKVERGLKYCKLHFALQGEGQEADDNAKWFVGVKYPEVVELLRFINKMGIKAPLSA